MSTRKSCDAHYKIPKLDASGKNWSSWKARLEVTLTGRKLLSYLHGMKPMPIDPTVGKLPAWVPTTPAEIAEVADYKKNLKGWTEKNALVQEQITTAIPDSLFICLA
ncbi:hypothetical protein PAXRUDRAFT_168597 [Paxillus rubicundulus Ve08.2h10]|uniref:Retrotransposon Copia-like N-terminal domain-containing protein n=1 Tax=Paxillus rubicundulus Ve08.2h10 TaxID=930991 RepID=A0A0D0DG57_9AGAM|nr:hypothetical protein PAXRUDRAFT_168597 [Paxillus rubicundulus Ve08.2h10]